MWTDRINDIVVINTNDDIGKKRMPLANAELSKLKISYHRYEAIKNNKDGAKGLLQTMRILFDENPGRNMLVFEDDVKFVRPDVNEVMGKAMQYLPEDFHCLYLGCNLLVPPIKHSANLFKIGSAYSSHAILYSAKGIDLILSLWSEEVPYDNFLMQKIQIYGNCYCVFPFLCSQRKGVSNIFKYQNNPGMERYYDIKTNEIDWGLMMEDRFKEFTQNV